MTQSWANVTLWFGIQHSIIPLSTSAQSYSKHVHRHTHNSLRCHLIPSFVNWCSLQSVKRISVYCKHLLLSGLFYCSTNMSFLCCLFYFHITFVSLCLSRLFPSCRYWPHKSVYCSSGSIIPLSSFACCHHPFWCLFVLLITDCWIYSNWVIWYQ